MENDVLEQSVGFTNLKGCKVENMIWLRLNMSYAYLVFINMGVVIYIISNTDRRGYFNYDSDGRQRLILSYFNPSYLDIVDSFIY